MNALPGLLINLALYTHEIKSQKKKNGQLGRSHEGNIYNGD